jgi:DegV family protein with EDD domain
VEFVKTFSRALEEGEAVVGVLAGSTLSGTFRSAEAAASRVEGASIHLVDSLSASLLQGLLVLKAAELAELGAAPTDIVTELRRVRAQSGLLFTVATLERLLASGRVSRGQALVGRVLALKPILGLDSDGVVQRYGKALGLTRARHELLKILKEQIPQNAKKLRFGIVQVGIPEIVEEISAELRAQYGRDVEILSAPATPVIATHLGIGTWGVAYLVED